MDSFHSLGSVRAAAACVASPASTRTHSQRKPLTATSFSPPLLATSCTVTITFPLQRNPSGHSPTGQATPGWPKLLDTLSSLTACFSCYNLCPTCIPSAGPIWLCVGQLCMVSLLSWPAAFPTHGNSCSPGLLLLDELLWPLCTFQMVRDQILNPAEPSCFFRR